MSKQKLTDLQFRCIDDKLYLLLIGYINQDELNDNQMDKYNEIRNNIIDFIDDTNS